MAIPAEADRGRTTEPGGGILVGRAPLIRLGDSLYLFIVTQDQSGSLPLTKPSNRPGGPPQVSLRWEASMEAEINGQWSRLEQRNGGYSANIGPAGAESIAQFVYTLPTDAEPERIRIRYQLEGFERFDPIEEVLAL